MSVLARFLVQIADVDIPANEAFLSRLGGSPGSPVPLLPTTYAYTRHLLDACCTAADQPRTADAFDRSVRYEIAFWQMAYTRGASDRA